MYTSLTLTALLGLAHLANASPAGTLVQANPEGTPVGTTQTGGTTVGANPSQESEEPLSFYPNPATDQMRADGPIVITDWVEFGQTYFEAVGITPEDAAAGNVDPANPSPGPGAANTNPQTQPSRRGPPGLDGAGAGPAHLEARASQWVPINLPPGSGIQARNLQVWGGSGPPPAAAVSRRGQQRGAAGRRREETGLAPGISLRPRKIQVMYGIKLALWHGIDKFACPFSARQSSSSSGSKSSMLKSVFNKVKSSKKSGGSTTAAATTTAGKTGSGAASKAFLWIYHMIMNKLVCPKLAKMKPVKPVDVKTVKDKTI